ncbi:MAG: SGNH/GDSL hydrolase family protein [Chloroflexota bacterium]
MSRQAIAAAGEKENNQSEYHWPLILRIFLKAAFLFLFLNAGFAASTPLDGLGRFSLYNHLFPGRDRLPYGEVPAEDYNMTLNNLPAMFASHTISQPKATDEFRVVLLGDSGTWGWFLTGEDTLAGQLNEMNLQTPDGRRVVVYNLGYPVMSLTKDLLILDEAMAHDPDLILWPITLQSFARQRQLDHPLLQNNADRVLRLAENHEVQLDPDDPRLIDRSFFEETILARRRDLADLARLQAFGFAWTATGIDQAIPTEIPLRATDLRDELSWLDIPEPRPFTDNDLAFDALKAGIERAGNVPIVLVNEPMFISDGANSDIRYNTFYPRWAYDEYRQLMATRAAAEGWTYLDLWDVIPTEAFTDTPVHLTSTGVRQMADILSEKIRSWQRE